MTAKRLCVVALAVVSFALWWWLQQRPAELERSCEAVVLLDLPDSWSTGFFVATDTVLTCWHAVEGASAIAIVAVWHDGQQWQRERIAGVTVAAHSEGYDLAALRLPTGEWGCRAIRPLALADHDPVQGDAAIVISNARGIQQVVTRGVVSQTHRVVHGMPYVELDAAINPGSSGGPVLSDAGEVIGIVQSKVMMSEGVAFAVPVRFARDFLSNLGAYMRDSEHPLLIGPPTGQNKTPPWLD
jgi:serine protease Do